MSDHQDVAESKQVYRANLFKFTTGSPQFAPIEMLEQVFVISQNTPSEIEIMQAVADKGLFFSNGQCNWIGEDGSIKNIENDDLVIRHVIDDITIEFTIESVTKIEKSVEDFYKMMDYLGLSNPIIEVDSAPLKHYLMGMSWVLDHDISGTKDAVLRCKSIEDARIGFFNYVWWHFTWVSTNCLADIAKGKIAYLHKGLEQWESFLTTGEFERPSLVNGKLTDLNVKALIKEVDQDFMPHALILKNQLNGIEFLDENMTSYPDHKDWTVKIR